MILPKLHDSLIERREHVAHLTETLQPFLQTGHAGVLLARTTPKRVAVYIAPRDEVMEFASLHANSPIHETDAAFAEAIVDHVERLAVPGVDGLAPLDSREWALVEVLREHRARLDLVVLHPESSACEILANGNPADREDFLTQRPGAIDLTALPLLDAVKLVKQRRAEYGIGLSSPVPHGVGKPVDEYLVVATHIAGENGDSDLSEGISTIGLDCRVPLEDRVSAVLDVWHTAVAIAELDDWSFRVVAADNGWAPEASNYEAPQGAYEQAGGLILGEDANAIPPEYRSDSAHSLHLLDHVTTAHDDRITSARKREMALVRISPRHVVEVAREIVWTTLGETPGSVRIDDAHRYAACQALADAEACHRLAKSPTP